MNQKYKKILFLILALIFTAQPYPYQDYQTQCFETANQLGNQCTICGIWRSQFIISNCTKFYHNKLVGALSQYDCLSECCSTKFKSHTLTHQNYNQCYIYVMVPTNPISEKSLGSKLKWIVILLFLGGIGYGIYWYLVIRKRNQIPNNLDDARLIQLGFVDGRNQV